MNAVWEFIQQPKHGEAYNLGGCKQNSVSVLEVIDLLDKRHNLKLDYTYSDVNRIGDHICYYSDMRKFQKDYPNWKLTKSLLEIVDEIVKAEIAKKEQAAK